MRECPWHSQHDWTMGDILSYVPIWSIDTGLDRAEGAF
jgi:hypothetical protein